VNVTDLPGYAITDIRAFLADDMRFLERL